jgi:hypothetical protein
MASVSRARVATGKPLTVSVERTERDLDLEIARIGRHKTGVISAVTCVTIPSCHDP